MEIGLFRRGKDILTTLGIGDIEILRGELEGLKSLEEINWVDADRHILITDFSEHVGIALNISMDLDKTPCETVEEFLSEVLSARFFIASQMISDIDGRKTIRLQVHPKYVENFPSDIVKVREEGEL